MELIETYQEIHKVVEPRLKDFLKELNKGNISTRTLKNKRIEDLIEFRNGSFLRVPRQLDKIVRPDTNNGIGRGISRSFTIDTTDYSNSDNVLHNVLRDFELRRERELARHLEGSVLDGIMPGVYVNFGVQSQERER